MVPLPPLVTVWGVLPLMVPTLIFGVSAAEAALGGTVPFTTPLTVLAALKDAVLVGLGRRAQNRA